MYIIQSSNFLTMKLEQFAFCILNHHNNSIDKDYLLAH